MKLIPILLNIVNEALSPDDLAKSIYSLAKYNNGYFKSPAQAQFLKGQLDRRDGVVGTGNTYGNSHTDFAEYDDKGIVKIERNLATTNKSKIVFQRKEGTNLTQADQKEIKRYKTEIKKLEQRISLRRASKSEFEKKGWMDLYNKYEISDLDRLDAYRKKIEKIETMSYGDRAEDTNRMRNEQNLKEIEQRKQQIEELEKEMQETYDDLKSAMEQYPEKAETFQKIVEDMMKKNKSQIAELEETIERLQAQNEKNKMINNK